jgi:hypothetical protein
MATMLAPNPTFAQMARTAESHHNGDVEDKARKRVAEMAPKKAKARRRGFL